MKKRVGSMLLVFSLFMSLWIAGCTPAAAPVAAKPSESAALQGQTASEGPRTVAEVEELAGFDVLEPDYLPAGVSLDFAAFEQTPAPAAILHFKLVHEQYGDMGRFFQIRQEPRAEGAPLSCGETTEGCELLQVGDMPVLYYLYASPDGEGITTESFEWSAGGFFFRLHRMAGEPNVVYKEELVNVVSSMK